MADYKPRWQKWAERRFGGSAFYAVFAACIFGSVAFALGLSQLLDGRPF